MTSEIHPKQKQVKRNNALKITINNDQLCNMKSIKKLFTKTPRSPVRRTLICRRVDKSNFIGDYRLLSDLGTGKFATVVMARHEPTERMYALKIVLKTPGRSNKLRLETEILELLTKNRHRLIVDYFGVFQTNGHICFVLELLDGGTLYNILRYGPLEPEVVRFYAACIISAIGHLHSLNIAHKDIKPQNVVVDHYGYAKVVDFGHSQMQIFYTTPLRNKLGTKRYKAPEYFEPGPIYRFVDFWAYGVTIHFMLTGKHLETKPKIKLSRRHITSPARDLLSRMFVKNPFERLGSNERGAIEIMEHEYFQGIDWDGLTSGQLVAPRLKHKSMPVRSTAFIYNEVKSVESFVEL